MSMPSDVNPDIAEAAERASLPPRPPRRKGENLTTEQRGWLFAALVAFFGVAYVGPALARFRRRPSFRQRMSWRLEKAQQRARVAGGRARKRLRRLGGGTVRR